MLHPTFKFAVNTQGLNKDWNFRTLSSQFQDLEGTLDDVIDHIQNGHAICAGLLNGKWRCKASFAGSYWVLAEIDNATLQRDEDGNLVKDVNGQGVKVYQHQMTLEEAVEHPFISQFCSLIYTTPSHQPDWHRFRLVFRLPEFITDINHYEMIVRFLLEQLPHDPSCKDGVRVFYGNTQAEFPLVKPSACLPLEWIEQAVQQAEEERRKRAERERLIALKREQFTQTAQTEGWNTDALIKEALSLIPPRTPGSGNYDECRQVLMALVDYYGAIEAEAIAERWSPSIKGETWNIHQKIKGFKRSGIKIGTLFYIANQYGFRFPQRQLIDPHLGEPDPIDYQRYLTTESERNATEQAAITEEARQQSEEWKAKHRAEVIRVQSELASLRVEPTICESGRYIPSGILKLPEKPGIILINGTMGVGKTSTTMRELVEQHRNQTGLQSTELLFVPRNTLGLQSGQILDLPHRGAQGDGYINRGTMCFESLHRVDIAKISDQPLILLDEVSQSFQQILEGRTCNDHHAFIVNRMRQLFKTTGERGGQIVLSEDGLTNCELDLIQDASGLEVVEYLKFERTPHGRLLRLLESPSLTWAEIQHRLFELNQNLWVPTDSQAWGRQIYEWALERGLDPNRTFLADRDSALEPFAQLAASDPQSFTDTYQPRLFIYTPVISSGVSNPDRNGHFHAVAFHITHLPARSAKQLIERLRTDVERFGFAVSRARASDNAIGSGDRPDLILKDFHRSQVGIGKLTQFAAYTQSRSADEGADLLSKMADLDSQKTDATSDYGFYLRHSSRYQARTNYEKKQILTQLEQTWEHQGYQIMQEGGKSPESKIERDTIKLKLLNRDASQFAELPVADLSLDEARDILARDNSQPIERLRAKKRILQDRLPGCPLDDETFVLKTLIADYGSFLRKVERYWLTCNPENAKWLDRWNWLSQFKSATRRNEWVTPQRLSIKSGQVKLLTDCPIAPFITGNVTGWTDTTPEAIAVHQWAVEHSHQFFRYCRLTIKEQHSPKSTVNKLLRHIGLEVKVSHRIGGIGQQVRVYTCTNLRDEDRDTLLRSLSERFVRRFQEKETEVEVPPQFAPASLDPPATSLNSQNSSSSNSVQVLTIPDSEEEMRAKLPKESVEHESQAVYSEWKADALSPFLPVMALAPSPELANSQNSSNSNPIRVLTMPDWGNQLEVKTDQIEPGAELLEEAIDYGTETVLEILMEWTEEMKESVFQLLKSRSAVIYSQLESLLFETSEGWRFIFR